MYLKQPPIEVTSPNKTSIQTPNVQIPQKIAATIPKENELGPNIRIYAKIFDFVTAANTNAQPVLSITEAFTGYTVITAIENKEAISMAQALNNSWFPRFGNPKEIHFKGGKVWVAKI
jgi:hypothetical protein